MNLTHFGTKREWVTVVLGLALGVFCLPGRHTTAVEDPVALVKAILGATDATARTAAISRMTAHPDYRPSRLSGWLHRAWEFPDTQPGMQNLVVPVDGGDSRTVHVIVPDGYRRDRAWPLIYALHPSGTKGLEWAGQVRAMLGTRAPGDPGRCCARDPCGRQSCLCVRLLEGGIRRLVRRPLLPGPPGRRHRIRRRVRRGH